MLKHILSRETKNLNSKRAISSQLPAISELNLGQNFRHFKTKVRMKGKVSQKFQTLDRLKSCLEFSRNCHCFNNTAIVECDFLDI